jgi:hypothetical protein
MRLRRWLLGLALLAVGCQASGVGDRLVPPVGSTRESRRKDVAECADRARAAYAGSELVSDADRARLQGRSTVEFFREGVPVVDGEYVPHKWMSVLVLMGGYAPRGVSDRYIVYLLDRGYEWPRADGADATLPGR